MLPSLPQVTCDYCGKSIDDTDKYCRFCGRRQRVGDAWYYSIAWIAFLAFFVIGPFALILVWKSTRMPAVVKKCLAALIVGYTAVSAYYFYQMMIFLLAEMAELDEVMSRF